MKYLLVIGSLLTIFTFVESAIEPCIYIKKVVATDSAPPPPAQTVIQFHVGTQCYADEYKVEADKLRCKSTRYSPPRASSLFWLTRQVNPATEELDKYNWEVLVRRTVQYPYDCHYTDTEDNCHAHFEIECSVIGGSEKFTKDLSIDFVISEHSKPKPPDPSCDKSTSSRLIANASIAKLKGRLEHKPSSLSDFASVCSAGFDGKAARVLCSEMCGDSLTVDVVDGGSFGPITKPIHITDTECAGNEDKYEKCSKRISQSPVNCDSAVVGLDCGFRGVAAQPNMILNCSNARFNLKLWSSSQYAKIAKVFVQGTDCSWDIAPPSSQILERPIDFLECNAKITDTEDRVKYSLSLTTIQDILVEGESLKTAYTHNISCSRDKYADASASMIPGTQDGGNIGGSIPLDIKLSLFRDMGFSRPILPGSEVPIDSRLYVQIEAKGTSLADQRYKLQVYEAVLLDAFKPNSDKRFTLLKNSCPTPQNVLQVRLYTQSDPHRVRLSFLPATFDPRNPRIMLYLGTKLCIRSGDSSTECQTGSCTPQHNFWIFYDQKNINGAQRNLQTLLDGYNQLQYRARSFKTSPLANEVEKPGELGSQELDLQIPADMDLTCDSSNVCWAKNPNDNETITDPVTTGSSGETTTKITTTITTTTKIATNPTTSAGYSINLLNWKNIILAIIAIHFYAKFQ